MITVEIFKITVNEWIDFSFKERSRPEQRKNLPEEKKLSFSSPIGIFRVT